MMAMIMSELEPFLWGALLGVPVAAWRLRQWLGGVS